MDGAEVLDDAAVGEEHGAADDPGAEGEEYAEDDGDDPDLGELPFDGALLEVCVVVGDGDGGQISEQGEEYNQLDTDGLVDDDHGGDEIDFQVQAESDTVLDICLHTLENLTGDLDGRDDGGKTGGEEDNISGGLGGFGSTFDGNTAVRLLQGGSVVHTVTSHGGQMATLLQHLDDLVLVLGEDFSETISLLDEIVLSSSRETTVDETLRVVDLGAESKHLASFLGNSDSVASQHLDRETEDLGFGDGRCGILTGRVEHGQHAEQLPVSLTLLDSNTERTETTASKLGRLCLVHIGIFLGAAGEVQDSLGSTLGAGERNAILHTDRSDTLGDGVERSELLGGPALCEDLLCAWVSLEGENCDLVDGIEGLDVVRGGESRNGHHPVDIDALGDEGLADGQLIGCERTGFVRAKDVDTLRT